MESYWKLLKSVKYLQIVSTTIGLSVPNLYFYKGLSMGYIVYWSILFLSMTSFSLYVVITEISNFSRVKVNILTVLEFLSQSFCLLLIAFYMTSFIILKRRRIVKICKFLESVEICLKNKFQCAIYYDEASLTLKLFICIIYNIFTFSCDFLLNNCFNQSEHSIIVWFYYNYYHFVITIVILQVYFFSHQIRCLFLFLNIQFLEMASVRWVAGSNSFRESICTETTFFMRRYDDLHKAMHLVNQVYCPYLILSLSCTMSLIDVSGLSITSDLGNVTCNSPNVSTSWLNIIKNLVSTITVAIINLFIYWSN